MKNQNGQSMFELVMSIGVAALIIIVLVSLVNNALQNAAFSKNKTLAARYAQSATEWLRGQRDKSITNFLINTGNPPSAKSFCLTDNPLIDASWLNTGACVLAPVPEVIPNTIFIRQVDFNVTSLAGKTNIQATTTVKWTDSKGTHVVSSGTVFSDWRQR